MNTYIFPGAELPTMSLGWKGLVFTGHDNHIPSWLGPFLLSLFEVTLHATVPGFGQRVWMEQFLVVAVGLDF